MATSDGSTLTHRQPAAKPLVSSSQFFRTPLSAPDARLGERIESLKRAVESILNGTKWPPESKDAAKGLLNTIKSSPDIPNNSTGVSQELQRLAEQYIQTLEEVHSRLKDASSKAGMQKWRLLRRIKSLASNRLSKCTLLFQTCQDDVSKAVMSFHEGLEDEEKKERDNATSGVLPGSLAQLTMANSGQTSTAPFSIQTTTIEQGITTTDSISGASPTQHPLFSTPEDGESHSEARAEALTIARKAFKGVEIASGSIPVIGNFVAAAAKVGLAFVESIQTMDRNDDLAKDLESQTSKLSTLLAEITKKPNENQGEGIANHIGDLQKELREMHAKVKGWESLGRFNKAFHSRDHAEALHGYQGTVQTALEETQLLMGIDTRSIVIELNNSEVQKEKRRLLDRLGDGKYGARGNAVEDVTCLPGTRVGILERIDTWIRDSSTLNRVLWIRGMAGRGKSTIASTVLHGWKCRASCAIFHFRRGQDTMNTRVICALARQLGSSLVPEVRNTVLESVQENQDIADERLEEQFKALFVTSLTKLDNRNYPILIVVDALDECDDPTNAIDFVRLIDRHSASLPANVKFLLTSRPEAHLVRTLELQRWRSEDLDAASDVSSDLERFIQHACRQIRDSDPDVPESWPSSDDVNGLVGMSQGLFQWARTAITYMRSGSPVDRLRGLLKQPSKWSGLDELYRQILSKAFDSFKLDPEREDLLHRVLGTLVVTPYPISLEVIAGLYGDKTIFDEMHQADIILFLRKDILADLNSLLIIPLFPSDPLRLMHTSIHDLLVSEHRCKQQPYHINVIRYHQQLGCLCLASMVRHLKENICNLSDFSKPSSVAQDIVEQVPKAVLYCCRSWSIHVTEGIKWPKAGTNASAIEVEFRLFSKEKIMCWLEVMSLIGATTNAIIMAKRVYQWLLQCPAEESELSSLATLWNDVQRFITTFSEPISFGPLHIYTSALPHCPVETELWNLYGKHAKVQTLRGDRTLTWPANLWTRSTGSRVETVAVSPDGKILASGARDRTIRLWDAQTGAAVGEPLTGHIDRIWSVCFSPDGKLLASGSGDWIIRIWDAQSGTAVGEPLTGHSGFVWSVCFSPDGKLLASGSDDGTIRLWDAQTGTAVDEPLTGHSSPVWSVCFSPDGRLLASGTRDCKIRLWDAQTGTTVGEPLTGHRGSVLSVCFSPDGKLLASGSHDETIQLWDAQTGMAAGEPLTGHIFSVESVCFSPDGKLLASGSSDGTIRLWDPQTGTTVGEPLTGHSNSLSSVCFSPDGTFLASGSYDKTIRLWDPQTGTAAGEPLTGHSLSVQSVCFLSDGTLLASGSGDHTIRLWDPQTGAAVGDPLPGHSDSVLSVCFSPDGKLLASGSSDQTIRLWDPQTGTAVSEPLVGHSDSVESVCFSPDGSLLASSSRDETIRLWDPQTGMAVGEPFTGHSNSVLSVCFSPDGKLLASGSYDQTFRFWDPQTGKAIGDPLPGHTDPVTSVHFSSDGQHLMANYYFGSFAAWDANTRQRLYTPSKPLTCSHLGFQDHWITAFSSRLFWLPSPYWGDHKRQIILSGKILVVLSNYRLSIFDISQILEP